MLYSLFDVRDGKFRFRQSAPPEGQWLPVRVSADRAVLEGTRWSEAWARAVEAIPSRHSRFTRSGRVPRANVRVSPTQWRVFVSTAEPGTLTQIAARAILSEVDVIESLQYLLDLNLVNRLDTTAISATR